MYDLRSLISTFLHHAEFNVGRSTSVCSCDFTSDIIHLARDPVYIKLV